MASRHPARPAARRRSRRASANQHKALYRRTPRYEPLENRRLLALVTVDTPSDTVDLDDGLTSLREAIFATNLVSGPDEITFDFGHDGPETIVLTQGELRITDDLAINGPGDELLTIDAIGNDRTPNENNGDGTRIFNIDGSPVLIVSLAGLTLTGGDTAANGGAILSQENLTIRDSVITGNSSGRFGGGIYSRRNLTIDRVAISDNAAQLGAGVYHNSGNLSVTACTISNNTAEFNGGGIFTSRAMTLVDSIIRGNSVTRGTGGGIGASARFTITIRNSAISDNSASVSGGGIFTQEGNVTLADSTVIGNSTGGTGGGIFAGGAVTISNSTISGNSADSSGGGIDAARVTLSNSAVSDNLASGNGGGIFASQSLTATNSIISGNSGTTGGGAYASTSTLNQCTINDNTATGFGGGGIRVSAVTVTNSTINSNSAPGGMGGGILMYGGTIANSTISGNTAVVGGGIYSAPRSYSSSTRIRHSTIAFNSATIGGGAFVASHGLILSHTILATNWARTGFDIHGLIGATASASYSLIGVGGVLFAQAPVGSPDVSGNLVGGDPGQQINPRLAPLADNGGPTKTHALFGDSPAIDAGDPMAMAGVGVVPEFDQRGPVYHRVFGSRIDIGALERQNVGSAMQLVVDTLGDEVNGDYSPGDLSLREAVVLANGNAGFADTILFDPKLAGGSIVLTHGELVINDALTIAGLGADRLTIDASGSDPTPDENNGDGSRIFSVDNSGTLSGIDIVISGMRLTGGDAFQGGAILFRGSGSSSNLAVSECTVSNNSSPGDGGGIFAQFGNAVIAESMINGNWAVRDGGAVYGTGNVTVSDSTISGNSAGGSGGGIYTSNFGSDVSTVTNCVITGNSAVNGGGVAGGSSAKVLVTASAIGGNTAGSAGGGIHGGSFAFVTVTASTISGNSAGAGGGIYGRLLVTVAGSTISGNSAASGGGIAANDATVVDSSIVDNMASGSGGGLRIDDRGLITDSLIANNSAGIDGGGIYSGIFSSSDSLSISNSTISQNIAGNNGGGVYLSAFGLGPSSTIAFSTIYKNVAGTAGGGIWEQTSGLVGTTTVASSIVADNSTMSGDNPDLRTSQLIVRQSLIGDGSGSSLAEAPIGMPDASGNLVGGAMHGTIDSRLGPLVHNGGPTMTHALLPGSPAINAGDPAAMAGVGDVPQFDQRGAPFTRVHSERIDIGGFEAQPNPLSGDYNFNGVVDTADVVVWRKTFNSTSDLRADGNGDGVVNQEDWQVWRTNFGRTAEGEQHEAESTKPAATYAPPHRPTWQPPVNDRPWRTSPGVSVTRSRHHFRPPAQGFALDEDLTAAIASPRGRDDVRQDFGPLRRQSMRFTSVDSAEQSVDAIDRVFESLGADVVGTRS